MPKEKKSLLKACMPCDGTEIRDSVPPKGVNKNKT